MTRLTDVGSDWMYWLRWHLAREWSFYYADKWYAPRFFRRPESIMCVYKWAFIIGPFEIYGPIVRMYLVGPGTEDS